jgi:hypothetical protein
MKRAVDMNRLPPLPFAHRHCFQGGLGTDGANRGRMASQGLMGLIIGREQWQCLGLDENLLPWSTLAQPQIDVMA